MAFAKGGNPNPAGGFGRKPIPPRSIGIEDIFSGGSSSIDEAASRAGCSDKKIEQDIRRGLLQVVRRGGFVRIPGYSLAWYLGYCPGETPPRTYAEYLLRMQVAHDEAVTVAGVQRSDMGDGFDDIDDEDAEAVAAE